MLGRLTRVRHKSQIGALSIFRPMSFSARASHVDVENIDQENGIVLVRLNRPEALNALSVNVIKELSQVFTHLKSDSGVRSVILTGAGRAFTAGIDLKTAGQVFEEGGVEEISNPEKSPVRLIESCPFPVIGAINGFAITGGLELALACDILVASTDAKFADTHAKVGVMPSWGMSVKLQKIIGPVCAMEMHLTGAMIDAERAEKWGLVSRVVPPEELIPTCLTMARKMSASPKEMLAKMKKSVQEVGVLSMENGYRLELQRAKEHLDTLKEGALQSKLDAVRSML